MPLALVSKKQSNNLTWGKQIKMRFCLGSLWFLFMLVMHEVIFCI